MTKVEIIDLLNNDLLPSILTGRLIGELAIQCEDIQSVFASSKPNNDPMRQAMYFSYQNIADAFERVVAKIKGGAS